MHAGPCSCCCTVSLLCRHPVLLDLLQADSTWLLGVLNGLLTWHRCLPEPAVKPCLAGLLCRSLATFPFQRWLIHNTCRHACNLHRFCAACLVAASAHCQCSWWHIHAGVTCTLVMAMSPVQHEMHLLQVPKLSKGLAQLCLCCGVRQVPQEQPACGLFISCTVCTAAKQSKTCQPY